MKKIILIAMVFFIGNLFIFASSDNVSIYTVESESEIIIDQLYESKNIETYKFIIDNAVEDGCIDVTYYIDDEAVKNYYNVLVFQNETSYFFIGTSSKCLFLRPDTNNKRFSNGKVDVSTIDQGFIQTLQNVSYIRKEKDMIRNGDLIMQFENVYNNHNYRIEFKYGINNI